MGLYKGTANTLSKQLSKLFNRKVSVTADDVKRAYKLTKNSAKATEIVTPYINNVLKAHNLKNSCHIKEGPCKRLIRIFAKKVGEDLHDIAEVPDVGRLRLLVADASDIEAIRKIFLGDDPQYNKERIGNVLNKHPTNEISISEFEDYYHVPSETGRVAIHLTFHVKTDKNIIVPYEVQVMLESMEQTEEFTRDNYINKQEIRRAAKNEGRPLTTMENSALQAYEQSSKERYTADCRRYNLIKLRRNDLAREDCYEQRALRAANQPVLSTTIA